MSEYVPPCVVGKCDFMPGMSESSSSQRLCRDIARCVIGAGGSGLLETTFCPFGAMQAVGRADEDPTLSDIRSKLGIVGYFEFPAEE